MAGTSMGIAGSSPERYVLALALTLGYFVTLFDVVDGALRLQDARANVVEVERLLALAAAVPPGDDALRATGELALENVDFAFDRRPVLTHVSHRFPERGTTAIVGRSGAGKTALAGLLAGLRAPTSGSVSVGGVNLATLSRAARTRAVTLVFQDTALTDGTIADNIAAGRPGARIEDVREAARIAVCDPFLRRLPNGLDTRVRGGGADFSLGERRRIAVARARRRVRGALGRLRASATVASPHLKRTDGPSPGRASDDRRRTAQFQLRAAARTRRVCSRRA